MHRRDQRDGGGGGGERERQGKREDQGLVARLLECHTRIREMLAMAVLT